MILIISTCSEKLSENEFVRPLEKLAKSCGKNADVINFKSLGKTDTGKYDKIIISGTAIQDFEYMNYAEEFKKITESGKPVFGICAGAQLVLSQFKHSTSEKGIIGKRMVRVEKQGMLGTKAREFPAYFMFTRHVSSDEFEKIAYSENMPVFFQKGKLFASYFHPEVLNREVLEKFLDL